MFRYAAQRKVYWPVTLATRGEDGEPTEATAYIGYQLLTRTQLRDRQRTLLSLMQPATTALDRTAQLEQADALDADDMKLLRAHIFGWRDIVDERDVPIAFSPKVLEAMCEDPLLFKALMNGLLEGSNGARAKNLLPGPGGAPAPAQRTTAAGSGTATSDGGTSESATAAKPAT